MPWTFRTMMIGTLAIAGVPLLAGFFSKDEILWKAFSSPYGHPLIYAIGLLVAGFTAFYMFRLMFLTFFGEERFAKGHEGHGHNSHASHGGHSGHGHAVVPHESPLLMIAPLMILAFFSAVVGFLGVPPWLHEALPFLPQDVFGHFLEPAFKHTVAPSGEGHHGLALEVGLALLSVLVAGVGIFLAYTIYLKREGLAERLAQRFRAVHSLLFNKYYVDEAYDATIVNRLKDLGNGLWAFDNKVVDGAVNGSAAATVVTSWVSGGVDTHLVDRLVNLVGQTVQFFSRTFRRIQTGLVQRYALFIVFGLIVFISIYLFWS